MGTKQQFSITKLVLPGVLLITPSIFNDKRGFFVETYNKEVFAQLGVVTEFVQDNLSYSVQNVLRGMHRQLAPNAQDKLVRCTRGEIFDVAADVDRASKTFGQHVSVTLTAENGNMLFVPGQYVHGFCVIGSEAIVEYKVSSVYAPESATGVRYNDPTLAISWPVACPILSAQDVALPLI